MPKNSSTTPSKVALEQDAKRISVTDRETYAECDRVRFVATLPEAARALQSCARDATTRDYADDPALRGQIQRCTVDLATRLLVLPATNQGQFDEKYQALLGAPYPEEAGLILPLAVRAMQLEAKTLSIELTISVTPVATH